MSEKWNDDALLQMPRETLARQILREAAHVGEIVRLSVDQLGDLYQVRGAVISEDRRVNAKVAAAISFLEQRGWVVRRKEHLWEVTNDGYEQSEPDPRVAELDAIVTEGDTINASLRTDDHRGASREHRLDAWHKRAKSYLRDRLGDEAAEKLPPIDLTPGLGSPRSIQDAREYLLALEREIHDHREHYPEKQREIRETRDVHIAPNIEPQADPRPRRAVIVTALPLEYKAVLRHLTDIKEHTHERGTVYETGSFDDWEVTVVEAGMGNDRAAVETERAITHADPQVVFFVGIAGGLKDADLGDVVAAETVYGYERGKQDEQFLSRPNVGLSSYALVQRARAEAKKDAWKIRMKNPAETARVFVGPLAAGEKVLTSNKAALREFLRQHYNDALAIEMEGRGFLAATYANHQTNAIVIRGISDLLENKSEGDAKGMQEIAADHATAFAFEVLAHF
jgi:nucleoside phosphorylase